MSLDSYIRSVALVIIAVGDYHSVVVAEPGSVIVSVNKYNTNVQGITRESPLARPLAIHYLPLGVTILYVHEHTSVS